MTSTPTKFTAQDYRAIPEGPPYYQLIEGELVQESPSLSHQMVGGELYRLIANHVRELGLGIVLIAPMDTWIDDENVFQPDVFFVSKARIPLLSEDGVHGAPDLVIEILSPSSAKRDAGQKRRIYADIGVIECWLVDPARLSVAVYRFADARDQPVQLASGRDVIQSLVLPGLKIRAEEIFSDLISAQLP